MQTVNAESKGLGKTLFGSLDRADKINSIDDVTNRYGVKSTTGILNAGRILYQTDDKGKYILDDNGDKTTDSMNGFVAEFGTETLNDVGVQVFPYDNKTIKSLFEYAQKIFDRTGGSITSNEEFNSKIFTAMKSYLFSNTNLFGGGFDIEQTRKDLFLGTHKEVAPGIYEVDKPSLPDIIAALKLVEGGIASKNLLIKSLIPDLRQSSTKFKLLKYTASTGQNLDESELHQAFISLFKEDVPLDYKIGDIIETIQSRKLAEDLIKYVYLSGGIQEAIQFTRYIPLEVLDYIGFSDKLKSITEGFMPSIFGVVLKDGSIQSSNVIEQIIQHNPKMIPVKIKGKLTLNVKENEKNGLTDVQSVKNADGVNVIVRFKPIVSKDINESTGEYMINQPYLVGKFDDSKDYLIYKLNNGYYEHIPSLGDFGVDEYNFNLPAGETAKSVISSRNLVDNKLANINSNSTKIESTEKVKEAYVLKNKTIANVLDAITESEDTSDYHKAIVNELKRNSHLLSTLNDVSLTYDKIQSAGLFNPDKGNRYIKISNANFPNTNQKIIANKDDLNKTILHEILHAYTLSTIKSIESGNIEGIPTKVLEAYRRIDTIRRATKYKLKNNDKLKEAFEKVAKFKSNSNKSEVFSHYDMMAYGLSTNEEFVTVAFESPIGDVLDREFLKEDNFIAKL